MKIIISKKASRQIKKTPFYIKRKFAYWIDLIKYIRLSEARKYKGFHDDPLKGKRAGQRSVRLSKSYRLVYLQNENNELTILEVHKHEY